MARYFEGESAKAIQIKDISESGYWHLPTANYHNGWGELHRPFDRRTGRNGAEKTGDCRTGEQTLPPSREETATPSSKSRQRDILKWIPCKTISEMSSGKNLLHTH